MKVKVYITLRVDEDEYPVPADGNVDTEIADALLEFMYDIDGIKVESLKVTSD